MKKKCRPLTSCEADSHPFLFSSHWTPRFVAKGIRGSHAQTAQHTVVLEGTHITQIAWHLSQTDVFSGLTLTECVRSAFNMSPPFFCFSHQNNFVPTAKMCHILSRCRQVKGERCALQLGISVLSSYPGKQRRCICVL